MNFKPKLAAVVIAAATLLPGAAVWSAGNAQATPEDDYFAALAYTGVVVWDYPLMLTQGQGVCQLLYKDINPIAWLTRSWPFGMGYDIYTASSIIISAQYGLCPGNAVTA